MLSQQVVWMVPPPLLRNFLKQFGESCTCSRTQQPRVPRSSNDQVPEPQLQSKCSWQEGEEISQEMLQSQDNTSLILFTPSLSLSSTGINQHTNGDANCS